MNYLSEKILKMGCCLILTMTLSFCSMSLFAQSVSSLEKEISNAKRQIELAEQMLKNNKNDEMDNLSKLSLISSQLSNRERIISKLRQQKTLISRDISGKNRSVSKLTKEQTKLRKEYAEMMIICYKNYIFSNSLLFLFSAKDFNELQMRIYYLLRYSSMRIELSEKLDLKAKNITKERNDLIVKNNDLNVVVKKTQSEINTLASERKKFNSELNSIKSEKKELFAKIKKYQDNVKIVQRKISAVVAEEARKQREAQKKAKPAMKEKYAAESSAFAKFKGRLEPPVEKGIIIERFGRHAHPIHKTHLVENKGVNFRVPNNSNVNSVFNGVVTMIFFTQGIKNTVMVRHGDYITAYTGLTDVYVESGDIVSVGQKLGKIKGESKDNTLHFEVWKGMTNLNPEHWISK